MCKFDVVSGRVTEVHRFINVPLKWTEQYPARDRREFWVATPDGQEIKLVVHSRQMPARVGHQVDVLVLDGQFVGLRNLTTGSEVNFMRVDLPLIWRRLDSLLMAVILLASLVAFLFGSVAAPFAGLILVVVIPHAGVAAKNRVVVVDPAEGGCGVGRDRLRLGRAVEAASGQVRSSKGWARAATSLQAAPMAVGSTMTRMQVSGLSYVSAASGPCCRPWHLPGSVLKLFGVMGVMT